MVTSDQISKLIFSFDYYLLTGVICLRVEIHDDLVLRSSRGYRSSPYIFCTTWTRILEKGGFRELDCKSYSYIFLNVINLIYVVFKGSLHLKQTNISQPVVTCESNHTLLLANKAFWLLHRCPLSK